MYTPEEATEKIRFRLITFGTVIILCFSDQKYLSAGATIYNVLFMVTYYCIKTDKRNKLYAFFLLSYCKIIGYNTFYQIVVYLASLKEII